MRRRGRGGQEGVEVEVEVEAEVGGVIGLVSRKQDRTRSHAVSTLNPLAMLLSM